MVEKHSKESQFDRKLTKSAIVAEGDASLFQLKKARMGSKADRGGKGWGVRREGVDRRTGWGAIDSQHLGSAFRASSYRAAPNIVDSGHMRAPTA